MPAIEEEEERWCKGNLGEELKCDHHQGKEEPSLSSERKSMTRSSSTVAVRKHSHNLNAVSATTIEKEKVKKNIYEKHLQALIEEEERDQEDFEVRRDRADADLRMGIWPGYADYEVGLLLGQGAFGTVHEGRCKTTKQEVAIKRYDCIYSSKDDVMSAIREMRLHVHLDVSGGRGCVAKLLRVVENEKDCDHLFAVYEKYDCNLFKAYRLPGWNKGDKEKKRLICYKISRCIAILHSCDVAHRDVKPENIVMKNDMEDVVMCDLGMARLTTSSSLQDTTAVLTDYVTTRWYRAPEVCCGTPSSAPMSEKGMLAADVWSLACVIGEILRDDPVPLFRGKSSEMQASLIGKALGPMDERSIRYYDSYAKNTKVYEKLRRAGSELHSGLSISGIQTLSKVGVPDVAIDLLLRMLKYDPRERISANEVLEHPFFSDLKEEDSRMKEADASVFMETDLLFLDGGDFDVRKARNLVRGIVKEVNAYLVPVCK